MTRKRDIDGALKHDSPLGVKLANILHFVMETIQLDHVKIGNRKKLRRKAIL